MTIEGTAWMILIGIFSILLDFCFSVFYTTIAFKSSILFRLIADEFVSVFVSDVPSSVLAS